MSGREQAFPVRKEFANIGGLRTHFWRAGTGPILLMLHGQLPGSCVAFEWGDHIARFAQAGFCVYAPDVAGFGQTDNPPDHSIETRIRHIRAFVDHFGFDRYSIWGSSMGGYMGCALALDDGRVEDLVLMPSTVLPPPLQGPALVPFLLEGFAELVAGYAPQTDRARQLLQLVMYRKELVTDDRVKLFVENSAGKNLDAHRARMQSGRPKALHAELSKLRNRVLLLWGADDSPERGMLLQRAIPGAELHMLQHCMHWPQVEYPERSFELVSDFLKRSRTNKSQVQ